MLEESIPIFWHIQTTCNRTKIICRCRLFFDADSEHLMTLNITFFRLLAVSVDALVGIGSMRFRACQSVSRQWHMRIFFNPRDRL